MAMMTKTVGNSSPQLTGLHGAIEDLIRLVREGDRQPSFGGDVTIKRDSRGNIRVSYRVQHVLPAAKPLDQGDEVRDRADLSRAR
jgi:hypothetical protein